MVAAAGSCTCDSDIPSQRGSFSLLVRLDLLLLPGRLKNRGSESKSEERWLDMVLAWPSKQSAMQ